MPTNNQLAKQLVEILWQRTAEFGRSHCMDGRVPAEAMISTYVSLLSSVISSCPDTATRAEVLRRSVEAIISNTRAWQPPPSPDDRLAAIEPEGSA